MIQMQRNVIVAFVVVVLVVAFVGNMRAVRLYKASALLQISSRAGQEMKVDEVVDYDRLSQEYTYITTQIDLLQCRDLREEVIRRYEALGFGDLTLAGGGAAKLHGMLTVVPRKDSELIDVSVLDSDPERAARLANLVTEVYREQNLAGRRDSAREAKVWLQEQLAEYSARIIDGNSALIKYETEHDLADADEDVTRLSASMDALNLAYGDVNTKRVLLETTVRAHERLLASKSYDALSKDMDTPLVASLTSEYSAAAADNAKISARYLESMPERQYSEAKLKGIQDELHREVERTVKSEEAQLELLKSKEASLTVEIDGAKGELLERQQVYEEYERLKLELKRSKEFYATLSQRDGELDLASRTHLSNVRVVDEARPEPTPVSPNVPRNMAIALLIGVVVGCAIGIVIEYVDDTISSPFDVATYLRVPFIGLVPRLLEVTDDRGRALYTSQHPSSPAAEAIRAMRTVLEMNPNEKQLRRYLITSSVSSEGKTSTTVGLAASFASLGRKVIIVDADLRRPRLHHIFGIPKEFGLSAVLKGGPIDGAIVPSGIQGLDVMPAGARIDGPNELLASVAMGEVLDQLDQRYDMVFIDTPPSGMLSDAAILSKLVDGVVFVVREQTVSRRMVKDVVFRLQQVGAPLLGVVVNDVDLKGRASKYKYYYEYRYRYDERPENDNKPDVAAK